MRGRSRDAAYWRHRIERDHPEIARRLNAGDIPSVRAAAIEAGLIHEPSGLVQLRRAWRRATAHDRVAFIAEVGVADLVPQREHGRHPRRRQQMGQAAAEVGDLFAVSGGAVSALSHGAKSPATVTAIGRSTTELSSNRATTVAAVVDTPRPALEHRRTEADAALPSDAPQKPRSPLPLAAPVAIVGVRPAPEQIAQTEAKAELGGMKVEAPDVPQLRAADEFGEPARSLVGPAAEGIAGTALSESAKRVRIGVRRLFGLDRREQAPSAAEAASETTTADGGVRVGQRYIKIDAGPGAWEVLAIFPGPLDMPHVRISSIEEPDTVRVVSVAALLDRRRYQLTR